jgi:hypothetical protein
VKGVQEQGLTYSELKTMARTSLQYAFLPGASLWSSPRTFVLVKDCLTEKPGAKPPSARCQQFLDGSEKAKLQWELEAGFRDFESVPWPVSASGEVRRPSAD